MSRSLQDELRLKGAGRLDALQDGDDAVRLDADAVEAGDQGPQIRTVEERDLATVLHCHDIRLGLDSRLAAREGFGLDHLRGFGDLHRQRAVADRDARDLYIGTDDDGAG